MKMFLREPLVHFLLLGAMLFAVHAALRSPTTVARDEVVVTVDQIRDIAAAFTRNRQRPPNAEELKGLVDAHVREEVFSREGIRLGLDRSDRVIRQRLEKEMEVIAENSAAVSEPTDAELAEFLATHAEIFRREPGFTFRQVFLNPPKRGPQLASDAASILSDLQRRGPTDDYKTLGDRSVLPTDFVDQTQSRIRAQLGETFVSALANVNPGKWVGPIESAYGQHLVWMERRTDARTPALDEVRGEVMRELMTARRQKVGQRFLEELLARYRVKIEWPEDAP